MESREQQTVWWKWSEFCLPIGTLFIDTSASVERYEQESFIQNTHHTYSYSVRFLPAKWFPDLPVLASGGVSLKNDEAPKFWGSVAMSPECRNLVPPTFVEAIRNTDPFTISSFLAETSGEVLIMADRIGTFEKRTVSKPISSPC